jgi:AcrR family transcriptional regulator
MERTKNSGGAREASGKNTSERILEAASTLLVDEGYAVLSMRKVAARIGLSQAAIYRHYTDKAQLVAAIIERGYRRLWNKVESTGNQDGDPTLLIAAGIRAYVDFACKNAGLFRAVMFQDLGSNRDKVAAFTPGVAERRQTFAILHGLISRGVGEGSFQFCDPEVTAQAVWAAMFGLASRMAVEPVGEGLDSRRNEIIERQIEIIVRGLRGVGD